MAQQKTSQKSKKQFSEGIIYINATFNNTTVTGTDPRGNVVAWSSGGKQGFKGAKKGTPHAAQLVAIEVAEKLKADCSCKSVKVLLHGPGPGRDMAVKGIAKIIEVTQLTEKTGVPFNGCRPAKKRRV